MNSTAYRDILLNCVPPNWWQQLFNLGLSPGFIKCSSGSVSGLDCGDDVNMM